MKFGVPPQESHARFREAVEIVLEACQNERLTWDGDSWYFEMLRSCRNRSSSPIRTPGSRPIRQIRSQDAIFPWPACSP
jgi:hypothetical protein